MNTQQSDKEIAYEALENNYENVIQTIENSGNIEEAYNEFLKTVDLALELLPESEHFKVKDIEKNLNDDMKDKNIKIDFGPDQNTKDKSKSNILNYIILLLLLLMPIVYVIYNRYKVSNA